MTALLKTAIFCAVVGLLVYLVTDLYLQQRLIVDVRVADEDLVFELDG